MNHELGNFEPTDDEILAAQLDGLFDDEYGDVTPESLLEDFEQSVQTITTPPKKIA
jgi:hypothetical protein